MRGSTTSFVFESRPLRHVYRGLPRSLSFGALIVAFHNVWFGLPMVLTLIGWGQIVKGMARFVTPQLSLRVAQRIAHERAGEFRIAGAFALAIAAFLGYLLLR